MIITDEKLLRTPCTDASPDEIGELVELLERELKYSEKMGRPGIGLACPQINIQKNVAIVRIDNKYRVDLVNCKIDKAYDKAMFRDEGCLSFPGRLENTMRHQEIYVKSNLTLPYSFVATGLMAVACQHELDHMNGILLPDNAIKQIIKIKVRPNDPCSCGSKIKFKRCCGVNK